MDNDQLDPLTRRGGAADKGCRIKAIKTVLAASAMGGGMTCLVLIADHLAVGIAAGIAAAVVCWELSRK